jgi:hypothetical protein
MQLDGHVSLQTSSHLAPEFRLLQATTKENRRLEAWNKHGKSYNHCTYLDETSQVT